MSLRLKNIERTHAAEGPVQGRWLEPLVGHWTEAACRHLASHARLVRVTVVNLRGSAPREPGASMLVDCEGTVGTIGGGRLEWRATALAREQLEDANPPPVRVVELVLGPDLGQCCGGRIELWLEHLTRADVGWLSEAVNRLHAGRATSIATEMTHREVRHQLLPALPGAVRLQLERGGPENLRLLEPLLRARPSLYIFGAGHVGQSLVRLLLDLGLFDIVWIDPRAEMLPGSLSADVRAVVSDVPAQWARAAPSGTRFVVMTHDHALDYELCRVVLQREDACWLGLIGSASKSARFRARLLRDGLPATVVSRLHCPIGVAHISSKLPAALAIAIAAQLLQLDDADIATSIDATACTAGGCESCGRHR
jgi:xanthine dehydrogenase accessory factor